MHRVGFRYLDRSSPPHNVLTSRRGRPGMAEGKPRQGPIREKPQLIADELRALIVAGDLSEGESLGHEPDLIERFGVSRPSLREALRILEAEGLITCRARCVRRGGGARAERADDRPDRGARPPGPQRVPRRRPPGAQPARTGCRRDHRPLRQTALRRQPARCCSSTSRNATSTTPTASAPRTPRSTSASSRLAGNQTLTIVAEMLNEIVSRAVTAVSQAGPNGQSSRPVDAASAPSDAWSNSSPPVTAPGRRNTGGPTWRWWARYCSASRPRPWSTCSTTTDPTCRGAETGGRWRESRSDDPESRALGI